MLNGDDLVCNMVNSKKDDGDHEIQLHRMTPQEHFIEAQVQQGDTLQAIALRFYCSVSIKRNIGISVIAYLLSAAVLDLRLFVKCIFFFNINLSINILPKNCILSDYPKEGCWVT